MIHNQELNFEDLLEKPLKELFSETPLDTIKGQLAHAEMLMAYYQCAILEVETKFKVLNEQFSTLHERNPINNIETRLKSMDSILRKLQIRGLPLSLDSIEKNLHDIAGVRIICSFIDDIYMLADCLTAQDDIRLIQRKDYISNPKPNGYRSLHLIVETPIFLQSEKRYMKVEVQLRTIAMDFWASLEHRLRYKKNLNDALTEELAGELKYCAETSAMLDIRMQNIRNRIEE